MLVPPTMLAHKVPRVTEGQSHLREVENESTVAGHPPKPKWNKVPPDERIDNDLPMCIYPMQSDGKWDDPLWQWQNHC